MTTITVAIPTFNGAGLLEQTLAAVCAQRLEPPAQVELLVCDSGSRDGSVTIARRHGADVIEIPTAQFSHGETRNLLMERSSGDHVAFLTQDSVPAGERWLADLLGGFSLADDVALTFGPYLPRPGATPMVARDIDDFFRLLSPNGTPRIDRLDSGQRGLPAGELLGPTGFFTDANGCVAREAWESVPFRATPYAEDHVLAHDMLRAGYAKAYVPSAAVVHSHEYSWRGWLGRSFDESRALHEVYGYAPAVDPRWFASQVWGRVGADWRWARSNAMRPSPAILVRSLTHHLARTAGSILGSRADRLPHALVRTLSLEGRGSRGDT